MSVFVRIVAKRSKLLNPSPFRPSPEKLRSFLASVDFMNNLGKVAILPIELKVLDLFKQNRHIHRGIK